MEEAKRADARTRGNEAGRINATPLEEKAGNSSRPAPRLDGDWIELFNGKDLTGWQVEGKGDWQVKDGVLVGAGQQTRLVSRVSDFSNVAVRVEAKLKAGANSGLHVRTTFGAGWRSGYEAQMANLPSQKTMTGGIYAWADVKRPLVNDDEWFTLTFVADDRDLRVSVNGRETSAVRLPDDGPRSGAISIQAVNQNEVWIRKVEVLRIKEKAASNEQTNTDTSTFQRPFNTIVITGMSRICSPPSSGLPISLPSTGSTTKSRSSSGN